MARIRVFSGLPRCDKLSSFSLFVGIIGAIGSY